MKNWVKSLLKLFTLGFVFVAPAQIINDWTNPVSARWDSPSSWALATLPASNQTVNITNSGFKAVNLDGATVSGFADSLTVSNLCVSSSTNGLSTLLLNFAGLAVPLKVLNSCTIGTNGTVDNFSSSFEVDGGAAGAFHIDGGNFAQVGGLTVVNAPLLIRAGSLNATNGNLTLGSVTLSGNNSSFNQDGGSIAAQHLDIENGSYTLASGTLYAIGGTHVDAGTGHFNHGGGTNFGDVAINAGTYTIGSGMVKGNVLSTVASSGSFEQNGGLVEMQEIDLSGEQGGFFGGSTRCGSLNITGGFVPVGTGGDVFVTNDVTLSGSVPFPYGTLYLLGGILRVGTLTVNEFSAIGHYYGSSNEISTALVMQGGTYVMWDGTLESPYLGVGAKARFQQNTGQNFVHGVLSISGAYEFVGGKMVTEGIYLRGGLSLRLPAIDTNLLGTFTNTGMIDLGGSLDTALPDASLGQARLATNATIFFADRRRSFTLRPVPLCHGPLARGCSSLVGTTPATCESFLAVMHPP